MNENIESHRFLEFCKVHVNLDTEETIKLLRNLGYQDTDIKVLPEMSYAGMIHPEKGVYAQLMNYDTMFDCTLMIGPTDFTKTPSKGVDLQQIAEEAVKEIYQAIKKKHKGKVGIVMAPHIDFPEVYYRA